jgi:hypothetical protein
MDVRMTPTCKPGKCNNLDGRHSGLMLGPETNDDTLHHLVQLSSSPTHCNLMVTYRLHVMMAPHYEEGHPCITRVGMFLWMTRYDNPLS